MSGRTVAAVLADAATALVAGGPVDTLRDLADLLDGLVEVVDGRCEAGILVRGGDRGMDLLASTSQVAAELEIFQVQQRDGPCVESMTAGAEIYASSGKQIAAQWPVSGPVIAAIYQSVLASPLRWRGHTFGSLNLLHVDAEALDPATRRMVQLFTDLAVLTLVGSGLADTSPLDSTIRRLMADTAVIEQAKGVLAYSHGLDMSAAYARLRARADESGRHLVAVAQQVVEDARRLPGTRSPDASTPRG